VKYTILVIIAEMMPPPRPTSAAQPNACAWIACGCATKNGGFCPISDARMTSATNAATTTGMKLRGFHSNSSSSTAISTEAIGAPKVAAMPADAPQTSSVRRSIEESRKYCANSDPRAPPVMMIGPSAPNGPPVPIVSADAIGFNNATRAGIMLSFLRIAWMASGIP
jgi:hypothetical protein